MDYSSQKIIVKNYPETIKISESEYHRTFKILFRTELPLDVDLQKLSFDLSFPGQKVVLKDLSDRRIIRVLIITTNTTGKYIFMNTNNLFAEIDFLIGEIEEIQDQVRDLWYPWLSTGSHMLSSLSRWAVQDIEVGLRYTEEMGFDFFGNEKVNELIQDGARVVFVQPGGALTKNTETNEEFASFEVNGFFMIVWLESVLPSLVTS